MIRLKYFDTIRMLLRSGKVGDEYVLKTEQVKIINTKAGLNEIPDPFYHVRIEGYVELQKDVYEKTKEIQSNQFVVDYSNGVIYFNSSQEGKTLTAEYRGRGVVQYPAERIYVHSPNPWAVENMQEFVEYIINKTKEFTEFIAAKEQELTDFVKQKELEFKAYIDAFILKADEKIDLMDTHINICINTTNECVEKTNECIEATDKANEISSTMQEQLNTKDELNVKMTEALDKCAEVTDEAEHERQLMHIDRMTLRLIWKEPVPTRADIETTYPHPEVGWTVQTEDDANVYRYDGLGWRYIQNLNGAVACVNETIDGLMSSEDYMKLKDIESYAQVNYTGEKAKKVLPDYFRRKTMVFVINDYRIKEGIQNITLQFPCNGIIHDIRAFCRVPGINNTIMTIEKISKEDYANGSDIWENILSTYLMFASTEKVASECELKNDVVNEGDYFRVNVIQSDMDNIKNITLEIDVNI